MKKLFLLATLLFALVGNVNAFIGSTNTGATTDNVDQYINLSGFQASSNMTISTLNARVKGITGRYKMSIWSGNSSQPSSLIRQAAEITNPTNGWYSFPLTSNVSITNGQWYWFAIWSDTVGTAVYCNTTGGIIRWELNPRTYGAWPTTLTLDTRGGTYNYSVYASPIVTTNPPPPSATNTYSVLLSWNPSSDLRTTGHRVYWGTASRNYSSNVVVIGSNSTAISYLTKGITYYFAVTATGSNGTNIIESPFSDEVSLTNPPTNTIPQVTGVRIILEP